MGEGHGEVPKEVQDEVVEEAKKDEGTPEKKMMVGSSGFVTEVKSLKETDGSSRRGSREPRQVIRIRKTTTGFIQSWFCYYVS